MGRKLGKNAHKHDDRTLRMARFFLPEIRVPQTYDFDKHKRPIPISIWGNDHWGDCVVAGEANNLLRLERIEQRRTVPLTDEDVVSRYMALTGAQRPGDDKDQGLVVLDTMRDWRNNGWKLGKRNYNIAAYGELDPHSRQQLRMAVYVFHGIHLGFWLPIAAQRMGSIWDYNGQTGPEWRPGSWGGHLVYAKAFYQDGIQVLSWGERIFVSNNFIEKYCDEAWAVIDSLDSWRTKQTINVALLMEQLTQISGTVNR